MLKPNQILFFPVQYSHYNRVYNDFEAERFNKRKKFTSCNFGIKKKIETLTWNV